MRRFICCLCHGTVLPDEPEHVHEDILYDAVEIDGLLPAGFALLVARENSERRTVDL